MQSLKQILTYHGQTKHHPHKYANSLGYLDWANQPNPYRKYSVNTSHHLQIPDASFDATIQTVNTGTETEHPLNFTNISTLFYYAFALAAIKSNGADSWALRMNASSGNLHPTEAYLIAPSMIDEHLHAGIYHYSSDLHILETLATIKTMPSTPSTDSTEDSTTSTCYVALSSVLYREIWKYGERAFRYCQLDTGHAIEALRMSAALLGWQINIVPDMTTSEIAALLGLDDTTRFDERELEVPDIIMQVTASKEPLNPADVQQPKIPTPLQFEGVANQLASTFQQWPIIKETEVAAQGSIAAHNVQRATGELYHGTELSYATLITTRRSAQRMNKHAKPMPQSIFLQMLDETTHQLLFTPRITLAVFVHNVTELQPGLYCYIRDPELLSTCQAAMHQSFQFLEVAPSLYLLEVGNFQVHAKSISCSQDIASDSHFTLGMLAPFMDELERFGAHRYKELYYECGYIGQRLYLSATAQGYDGTGIGCFLDDIFHQMLGIKDGTFQSLYHFTIGEAIRDDRIVSQTPYAMRR